MAKRFRNLDDSILTGRLEKRERKKTNISDIGGFGTRDDSEQTATVSPSLVVLFCSWPTQRQNHFRLRNSAVTLANWGNWQDKPMQRERKTNTWNVAYRPLSVGTRVLQCWRIFTGGPGICSLHYMGSHEASSYILDPGILLPDVKRHEEAALPSFSVGTENTGPSQWSRGLRHEPSSPARTRRSWVRIPLEAWMSVCVYSVSVLPCV
jgi:hypothetical protein